MSRAAIWTSLVEDEMLNDYGITEDTLFHNYSMEERPVNDGAFGILRWQNQDPPLWQSVKPPARLDIWIHYPKELSNDYSKVITVLNRIDTVFNSLIDVDGSDGDTVSFVRFMGRSADYSDDGFNTISKSASYEIYYRTTTSVVV